MSPITLILVALGVAVLTTIPPLLDGVERKVKARVHSRIGPPILQTWYDLLKLFEKDFITPYNSLHLFILIILLFIMEVLLIAFYIVFITVYSIQYDIFIVIALFMITQVIFISIPLVTTNPFAIIGASREIMLTLVNEIAFIILFGLYAFFANTSSFNSLSQVSIKASLVIVLVALFISSYVASGRIPFDIAEAEPELASGIVIELSGPLLGLFLYSMYLRRLFVKIIPLTLLLGLLGFNGLSMLFYSILAVVLLWIIYCVIAAILARSRVDIAPVTLLKIYSILVVVALITHVARV